MIVAKQKPFEEIRQMIERYDRILVLGCGTCVAICLAGGDKEVAILASALRMAQKISGRDKAISEHTVDRQCEWEFLDEIEAKLKEVDAVLSLGCGIGVQAVAERFPEIPVFPGLNTLFMGMSPEEGVWAERCGGCGNCILDRTGGICPVARCAKSLFNGPCGGSVDGKCEVSPDIPCAWQLIYERMAKLGVLDRLEEIEPPRDWSSSYSGGPRKIIREDLKLPRESS
jgi:ferredoxin